MKQAKMDLSRLIEDRVHLTGFDCEALRALRTIRAVFHPLNIGGTIIEFWEHSTTNPAKVVCIDCWRENDSAVWREGGGGM